MWSKQTIQLIHLAIEEDLGQFGDITSRLLGQQDEEVAARVVPRAAGVICGLKLGPRICEAFSKRLGRELRFEAAIRGTAHCEDGQSVQAGESVATARGPKAAVLAAERTLLNFLCRMSGVATLTHRYVERARQANPSVQILDTRKTIPGWRELDKYAVRIGGGSSHRMGLHDAVLIKDNHLAGVPTDRLASTLFQLLNRLPTLGVACDQQECAAHRSVAQGQSEPGAQATGPDVAAAPRGGRSTQENTQLPVVQPDQQAAPAFIEVEVDNLKQLAEVCKVVGVNIVLLDNFSIDEMREAVEYRDLRGLRGKLALEASGKVSLETVAEVAATGVDRISVGALTHSAPCLDIALDF
jgi:nicotinate-nucleotide pyrophosphorylase (carboxylating)